MGRSYWMRPNRRKYGDYRMRKLAWLTLSTLFLWSPLALTQEAVEPPAESDHAWQRALIEDNCLMCHSDGLKTGGLSLESFDPAHLEQNAEVAEMMIRKLRTGMMPPSYAPRPEASVLARWAEDMETRIDLRYFEDPKPGRRVFQRLNRAEYKRSIEDLLALDLDVGALLPPDTISHSFDNIADVQGMSPTLMDSYLRAADQISRLAVGDPTAEPADVTYKVRRTANQRERVPGAPFGTRGGTSAIHVFPADGEYVFKVQLHGDPDGYVFGRTAVGEHLEVAIDGKRVALIEIDRYLSETEPNGLNLETGPIAVKAGPRRVTAAFLETSHAPIQDLMFPIEHTLADSQIGRDYGITALPHLRDFSISGPYNVTGVSDTPARRKIFTCRPTSADEELECTEHIVTHLAERAYRRPLEAADTEALMSFYAIGREDGDFESGIRMALQALLSSPSFIFRLERASETALPGESYRIADLDLASRLSFFLWSSPPDEELLTLAEEGELNAPEVIEEQVRRMLEDPRADTLATRFAAYWLRLQDLEKLHPDALSFPLYDATLADAMKRESELFFEHLVREDRSVVELLTADYTFVNERLARHYRIPNVTGEGFRKVPLTGLNASRRGLFGQGSILALTSIANRTSPVQRGKWIMEVLLGSPPPPPPPNVPALEETSAVAGERRLSVRERMESHRANPACSSCHSVIDPLGLALENFDVTGAWRTKDDGVTIDASGELYDGTPIEGPLGLRDAMLTYQGPFLSTFTESLLTYAMGRRVEYFDMPAIRKILSEAHDNDDKISSFIMGVVQSAPFLLSTTDDDMGASTEAVEQPH